MTSKPWLRWLLVSSILVVVIGVYVLVGLVRAEGGQPGWTISSIMVVGLVFSLLQTVGSFWQHRSAAPVVPTRGAPAKTGMMSLHPPTLAGPPVRGRDQLVEDIASRYRWRNARGSRVQVLYGMGGAGKTTVAQLVAQRLTKRRTRRLQTVGVRR